MLIECDICGEEVAEDELEPRLEGFMSGYYGGPRGAVVVHEHYQICSYDYGRRPAEELATIQLEELAALGAKISDEDRAHYLGEDVPNFDDFGHWEYVFDAVQTAEDSLPAGLIAVSSADAGTWQVWAIDRDAFARAFDEGGNA